MESLAAIAVAAGLVLLVAITAFVALCVVEVLWDEYEAWQERRRARIEAELDAKSEQLRQTILSLADDLATDRDEASKALTRAMFSDDRAHRSPSLVAPQRERIVAYFTTTAFTAPPAVAYLGHRCVGSRCGALRRGLHGSVAGVRNGR